MKWSLHRAQAYSWKSGACGGGREEADSLASSTQWGMVSMKAREVGKGPVYPKAHGKDKMPSSFLHSNLGRLQSLSFRNSGVKRPGLNIWLCHLLVV